MKYVSFDSQFRDSPILAINGIGYPKRSGISVQLFVSFTIISQQSSMTNYYWFSYEPNTDITFLPIINILSFILYCKNVTLVALLLSKTLSHMVPLAFLFFM